MDDFEFESESYEEVEEDDVSHDESPQVIIIVTALPSAGSHRPHTRLSLPDSGYKIDNVQSTVSANMLRILKKTFSISNTVFLHLPQDNDLPNFPLEDKVTFCSDFFRFGVRLPLHPFISRVLCHYKLAPSQLCPNGRRILVGTLALFRSMYNDDPSLAEFQYLNCLKASVCSGWYYFHPRPNVSKLILDLPDNNKNWKQKWFLISGSWDGELRKDGVIRSVPTHFGIPGLIFVLYVHTCSSYASLHGKCLDRKGKPLLMLRRNLSVLLTRKKLARVLPRLEKTADLPPVSSTVAPSVVLTPQVALFPQSAPFGQVSAFGHPMPFGQPTSFGSTSQSPSLGGASDLSVPFPREPRVGNDTHSGYLQCYSQRVMGMAGVEEDSLMTRFVDEVVASFDKMHLQYGFMASHFTESVCKLATEVSHHKQRISFLDDSIKNLEHQLQERDAKLMDRDNSIRVLELDRELVEKTVSELKSEKAQLEAQKAFLVRKMEKRERVSQRDRKRNANVYLRGYMDAQTKLHGRDPSYPLDWMAYPYNQEVAQAPDSPGSADSPDSSKGNDTFPT
ncbi:hypothetical protein LWI29_009660 [Acer saccharum]|uniref:Transposase (putative) gypsy type domain-containing protein n=1 Tax=Acer saccharum TaxID=4024 RepID=A0AA39RQG5_ACESA|nr:hypothetical protein LWI29_009660 [Acer saccharum]